MIAEVECLAIQIRGRGEDAQLRAPDENPVDLEHAQARHHPEERGQVQKLV
jgi:hypothetical protein